MVDPVTAELGAEGIQEASGLVERWLDSIQDRNDQIADRIVYEATLALANMRTYCDQARLIHVPLQGFSRSWPRERRDQLREAWIRWRSIYDVLPALEMSDDTLQLREVVLPTRWWRPGDKKDQQTADALQADLAETLAMFLDEVAKPIRGDKLGIRVGDFDSDPYTINEVADRALYLVEGPGYALVARARTKVVRLREIVLRGRPGLPQQVWRQLDALAFGGQAPRGSRRSKLHARWSNATKLTKVIFGVLVGLATIIPAVDIVWHAFHGPRTTVVNPAAADAKALNSLRAGELFPAFQHSLKVRPKANVWGRPIRIKAFFGSAHISDYLFVLHTVYVEAFVGSNNSVDAYTITARTGDLSRDIMILGQHYHLGKTTLATAPLPLGISLVAAACGAHIGAYYEISNTAEATLNQTVAVGTTSTGSLPRGYIYPVNICNRTDSLTLAAGAPGYNRQTGYYRIEERYPTAAYLADTLSLRRKTAINAVTVTASGYPVVPEMISLHPEEVAPYESRSSR